MDDARPTTAIVVIVVAIVAVVGGVLLLSGGPFVRVLSTVGGSVSGSGGAAAPVPVATSTPATPAPGMGVSADEPLAALRDDASLVYTGQLDLVVRDVPDGLAAARERIARLDGYVGASEATDDGTARAARLTFRIPAARWDVGLGALRDLAARVVRETTRATEVSGELIDLEARLRSLRAGESSLVVIAANAGSVADLLDVQQELARVRGEIERLDAARTALGDRVAYGTLEVTFRVEVATVAVAPAGWDAATEVERASARLVTRLEHVATVLIWFAIAWLPFLVPFAVIVTAVVIGLRRLTAGWRQPWGDPPRFD